MKFYRQPQMYTDVLDVLNMIFTAVFALEFVFKLAAFRFKVQTRVIYVILYVIVSYISHLFMKCFIFNLILC